MQHHLGTQEPYNYPFLSTNHRSQPPLCRKSLHYALTLRSVNVAKWPKYVAIQLIHHLWNVMSLSFGVGFPLLTGVDNILIMNFSLLFRNNEEKLDMYSNLLVKMQLNQFS